MTRGWLDRWLIPIMVAVVAAFVAAALVVTIDGHTPQFKPLSYSPQQIERVAPNGDLSVPLIDGYDEPAIRLGDTVPVRGTLTVDADRSLETRGNLIWAQVPPGRRFVVLANVARLQKPGTVELVFNNPIPADVAAHVTLNGASLWRIKGTVDVLEPNAIGSTFETASFWLVP